MSKFLYTNNAATLLAAGITNVAITLTVATSTGSYFPSPSAGQHFNITVIATDDSFEIIKVTSRSTDSFTIVRAQEGTTAKSFSLGDRVELRVTAAGTTNMLQTDDIGISVQGYDATTLKSAAIGTTVQAYDVDTAKLDVDQTWTGAQRGYITPDNDGSFDQSASNNFFCTPTGAVALTFTNHTSGQSGLVLFVNSSNYAITAAATTYIAAADLTKLSATGTYLIAYLDNGTNAYCTVTAALTSAGA